MAGFIHSNGRATTKTIAFYPSSDSKLLFFAPQTQPKALDYL